MNIQQAKEQIRNACIAYLTKDEFGDYLVPVAAQRPIFMMGAPGVGKTAVVAQVACELDLALVDYSLTHHTRQSAIGLPLIERRRYAGREEPVSEYTMSEIIANIHETMETTGKREGILFLDEINCVSESLAPMMLRFLQSKMFGTHQVPQGWVVVTAGNPVEYNKSARAFDVATLDRLKRVDVEPDYPAWRAWAAANGTHPAILSFLDMRPESFHCMETKGRVRQFVTARAWTDLSSMMKLYEANGLAVDADLVGQYVQVPSIAQDFAVYLEMFASYAERYPIKEILSGTAPAAAKDRAAAASFDERAALCGLVVDSLAAQAETVMVDEKALMNVRAALLAAKSQSIREAAALADHLESRAQSLEEDLERNPLRYRDDHAERYALHKSLSLLREASARARHEPGDALSPALARFNQQLAEHFDKAEACTQQANRAIRFASDAFGDGNELVLLLNEMTMNPALSQLAGSHGIEEYSTRCSLLMIESRAERLLQRLESL